jgi:hypothetical protein
MRLAIWWLWKATMSIGFAIGLLFRLDKHRSTLVSYIYLWYKAKQRFRAEEFQIPPHRQALPLAVIFADTFYNDRQSNKFNQ